MHRVVPELIIENYRAGRYSGEFPAVGMFLDLSGFSSMTDTLMMHGQHGAEVLANLMHGVFDPLVEGIFDYGGKIVGFAGDGIMALFPVETDPKLTTLRALTSAWLIQQRLAADPGRNTIYGTFQFTAKIGLTYGDVSWGILHSEDQTHATYFFRGSAVDDAAMAEHHARAGEIILRNGVIGLLGNLIQTEPFDSLYRMHGFNTELPSPERISFPLVDLEISRIFMPEEIIAQNARGEFRQVVNLFVRFPDLPNDELQAVTRIVFELRKKYGGLLNRIDFGDKDCNILMLWGAPVAYENDISRALNFILDLQEQLDFPVTAGVTYYVAHAGYLGSVMCEDYTCYGWGVNLASRFMMTAPLGEIWVDDRIARRVSSRFELEFVGEQRFKGFSALQKVHRLRRYNLGQESVYQGEIVGREMELAHLDKFVDPIWSGQFAGVLLILGDAGIGKGRLAQAFRSSRLFETNKALWAFCQSEQILRESFNPFRSWLFHYFRFTVSQDATSRKAIFDAKLDDLIRSIAEPDLARELDRLRSLLGALVDLYWEDSLHEQLDAEGRYNSTLLALLSIIKAESLRQPVILFVEDVQFIDDDSLNFLPRLKRSILAGEKRYPVAIITTSRIESHNPVLESDLVDEQLLLHGLSREAVARLVEILLGGVPSLDLVNLVTDRSEGNPYFIEQIVRYLQEESLIEMSASGWNQVRRLQESFLPGDIGALLVARLDQLSHKVKEVIQTASVFGREFMLDVLSEMTAEGDAIEQYVIDAELSAIWVGDQNRNYVFSHGLLRDAAYTMQMRSRRQELHALAVTALEKIYADDLKFHYAEVAHHSESAGSREKALQYYILAGKSAAAAYQNSKGIEYFTKALSFTLSDDQLLQFDLLTERIELLNRSAKREMQWTDLSTLDQLAQHLSDAHRSRSLMLHTIFFYVTGKYNESIEHAQRAFALPELTSEYELSFSARISWSVSLLRLGKADEAMQLGLHTLELARASGDRRQLGRVLSSLGMIAFEQKEPAGAERFLKEAVGIAHELKDRNLESRAVNNLAMFEAGVNGNYAQAHDYYIRHLEISHELGDRLAECYALSNLGFIAGLIGNFPDARRYLEQALSLARETSNIYQEIYSLVNLSSIAGIQHDASKGYEHAQKAIHLSQKTGEMSGQAWGWLYLGHAQLLLNELQQARVSFQRSLEIRQEMRQPALSMEPLAGLVEVGLRENDLQFASTQVEKILSHFDNGGTLNGTDEPLRVYYNCYQLLKKIQDPRTAQVLQAATRMLEEQLSKFRDEHSRKMYVENVPWRLALRNAATPSD